MSNNESELEPPRDWMRDSATDNTPEDTRESTSLRGYPLFVFVICCLAVGFDNVEAIFYGFSIPVWIQEWNVDAATLGLIATVSNWVGLIGITGVSILATCTVPSQPSPGIRLATPL